MMKRKQVGEVGACPHLVRLSCPEGLWFLKTSENPDQMSGAGVQRNGSFLGTSFSLQVSPLHLGHECRPGLCFNHYLILGKYLKFSVPHSTDL